MCVRHAAGLVRQPPSQRVFCLRIDGDLFRRREEIPASQEIFQQLRDQGLVVLAVNTTYQDDEAEVKAFVDEYGLGFPVLFDWTGDVSRRYQLRGLPSTYFVDRDGVIQLRVVGRPMDESLIRSKIGRLLREGS